MVHKFLLLPLQSEILCTVLGELYGVPTALLPGAISEHGPDTPGRAEDVERLGEAVVVNEARVDGEDPH